MHLFFRQMGPKRHKGRIGREAIWKVEVRSKELVEKKGIRKIYYDSLDRYEARKLRTIKPVRIVRGTLKTLGTKLVQVLHQQSVESKTIEYYIEKKPTGNRPKSLKDALDSLKPHEDQPAIRHIVQTVQDQLKAKNESDHFSPYEMHEPTSEQDLFSEHIQPHDHVTYLGANTEMQADSALSHIGTILAQGNLRKTNRLTLIDRDHAMIWPGKEKQVSKFAQEAFWKLGHPRLSGDPIFHRMSQREFLRKNPETHMVLPKILIADVMKAPVKPGSQDKVIDHSSNWFIVGAEGVNAEVFVRNAQKLAGQYDRFLRPGGKAIITFIENERNPERQAIMVRQILSTLAARGYRIQIHPLLQGRYRIGDTEGSRFQHVAVVATKPKTKTQERMERLMRLNEQKP